MSRNTGSAALRAVENDSMKGRGRLRPQIGPRVNFSICWSEYCGSLSVRRRMRRRIFWYRGWHICNLLSREPTQFTKGYIREKSTKMHQKEHRSILTESVSKVASIELLNIAFESPDITEQKSQRHRVPASLMYAFPRQTSKTSTKKHKRVVHFVSSRKLRKEADEILNQTISDAVFQGLHAPYCRLAPNSPLRRTASKLSTDNPEKSTFFVYMSLSWWYDHHQISLMKGS